MIHYAKGVDDDGNLQLDIVLRGNVPEFENTGKVVMEPYKENYIQTGPGNKSLKDNYKKNNHSFL